jgi:MFS family permease
VSGVSLALVSWALRTPPVDAEPQPARTILTALRAPLVLAALWLMVLPALLFGVVSVLVPLELGDAGWSAAAIAAVFIGAAAVEMIVVPLLGRFSDRRGRLLPLRVALGASVFVVAALALAGRPAALAPLVVCASIVFGAFWAPATALLSDGAERIGLAQGFAFGLMNAAWGGGNSVGPSLGGALADAAGDAFPYALMALLCALTFLAVSLGRRLFGTPLARVPESP